MTIALRDMPKNRLALLIAVAAAALALGVVGLLVTVAWLRAEPDCAQVREDRIDEQSYGRLEELARFTEALAVLEHAHKQYKSVAEARKLTDEFERLPVLRDALAHFRKNAPPEPDEKAPPSMQSRLLGASYVALDGFPKRLAAAMSGGDRGLVARTARTGADLLTNVAEYLGKGAQSPPKAVVDTRQLVQAEIEALRTVQYACGHCGDPKADRVPVASDEWVEYRCGKPRDGCLPREKYSNSRGLGCPGQGADEQLCCPP